MNDIKLNIVEDQHKINLIEEKVKINLVGGNTYQLQVGGDMNMSVYDTDFNGIIDTCQYIDCGEFN